MMSYNFKQKQHPPKDNDILQVQTKTISTKGYWYPTKAKQYSPKYNNVLHGQKKQYPPKDNDVLQDQTNNINKG